MMNDSAGDDREEQGKQMENGTLGEEDEWRFNLTELHPPLLIDFDLLRKSRPRPSSLPTNPAPKHNETPHTPTTETEKPPQPPLPISSSSTFSHSSIGSQTCTFGNVYQPQPDPSPPEAPSNSTNTIIVASSGEESDGEMVLPESIRSAFLFRRSRYNDPSNVSHGTSGRVFRQPRLRKAKNRRSLDEFSEERVLEAMTRHRRERKRSRRKKKEVAPIAPSPDIREMEDETLDLESSIDWKGGSQFMEQDAS
jgi:hypothetical protein